MNELTIFRASLVNALHGSLQEWSQQERCPSIIQTEDNLGRAMSFLDRLNDVEDLKFNPQQAIMIVAIAAIRADGDVSEQEISRVKAMCVLSPIFCPNTPEADLEVIRFAENAVNQLGWDAVERAAQSLPPQLNETSFSFACDLILADGIVGAGEREFIGEIAGVLHLDDQVADSILQNSIIRNRGA